MTEIFISSDNILSPIGVNTAENFEQLTKNISGIKLQKNNRLCEQPFYAALFTNEKEIDKNILADNYTKFEKLLITSISDALANTDVKPTDKKSVLIISSTKGNISLLETEKASDDLYERISLNSSARVVANHFGFIHQPVIISNACISGMLAIITGMRLIQSGQYNHAIVAGADVISKFILSGFQSFQAISPNVCKPFDAARDGINLGEGASTIVLTSNKEFSSGIKVTGGSVSNDANHISGPSRTGEELNLAINKAMKMAAVNTTDIGFISSHGTATVFNDEMEAKAITLAGLKDVPVNSLKGYYGHTLGAAGLIESVVSIKSLKENTVLPTPGFETPGVTQPVNVCTSIIKSTLQHCLKTASGFGGCNAAMVFSKQ